MNYLAANWQQICQDFERQKKCHHLKGWAIKRTLDVKKDYNISLHTFPNGTRRIRCLYGCGFEVWEKSEFKFKWQYGMKMVELSTNTASASQVVFPKLEKNGVTVSAHDYIGI